MKKKGVVDPATLPMSHEAAFERPAEVPWPGAMRATTFEGEALDVGLDRRAAGAPPETATFGMTAPELAGGGPGPGFLDPGSFALATHRTPLLESHRPGTGAVSGASAELESGGGSPASAPGPSPAVVD